MIKDSAINISKGIAIILMVIAHTGFSQFGDQWINMFHMPLFFFFAGYCFKHKYLTDFKSFVSRRVQGLYIPFIKYGLIFLLFHNVFFLLNIYNEEVLFNDTALHPYTLHELIARGFRIITSMQREEQLLGGYWFLRSLFWASLFSIGILKITGKKHLRSIYILGGGILITTILAATKIYIPYFGIGSTESFAVVFFLLGTVVREYGYIKHINTISAITGTIFVTLGAIYWQQSLLNVEDWKVIPYTVSAMGGICMVYYGSIIVQKCGGRVFRFLNYAGDNTLTILTWHFLCFKLISILIIRINCLPIRHLADFPTITEYSRKGWWTAYLLAGVCIPLLLAKLKTVFYKNR